MIGGFIVRGKRPNKVLVRAIGPSFTTQGTSDNWRSTQQPEITATGILPTNSLESVIVTTLQPGNYTVIVRGKDDAVGVALVEVYNLDSASLASK